MYAFVDYTWNIFFYKPYSYACKWCFLVQAGVGLWAKCTGEPRAYSTSAVHPLPFVNMDPSKLSTMYTCILLAAEQCKKCAWYCITISLDLPLAKTTEMFLTEGQLTLVSGVNVRLGRFHYMLLSWVRSVTENGIPMPVAYMHVHSSFERDNNMQRTVLFTWHVMNGRAYAKGTREYLLPERALATSLYCSRPL